MTTAKKFKLAKALMSTVLCVTLVVSAMWPCSTSDGISDYNGVELAKACVALGILSSAELCVLVVLGCMLSKAKQQVDNCCSDIRFMQVKQGIQAHNFNIDKELLNLRKQNEYQ